MTIENINCICETAQAFVPDLCKVSERLVRRSEAAPRARALGGKGQSKYFWFESNDSSFIVNRECSMQKLLYTM
jgi:hypothetical protein